MDKKENKSEYSINRREFLKQSAGALLGTAAFAVSNVDATEITPQADVERRNEHPDMRYRRLGKTNLMVSALGLGGAYHYGPNALSDQDAINKTFDRALDLGINYFDTSPDYGTEGHFAHLAKSRERCFIATKVNTMSAEGSRSEVENSLKVMNTDYLDVVQTHYKPTDDDWTGALEALEELNKLRDEGKIRFVGFTHHSYDALKRVLTKHVDLIDTILLLYSFHPETSGAEEIIDLAHSLDVGVVAMKVFRGASESWKERVKKWKADEAAWSRLSQHIDASTSVGKACLKYVLKNPKLSTAIVGMQSIAQVEENAKVPREIKI
ncbi:MAG: aldo/keto reductase [Candidatus Poribacteria bacterium]